jgi:hypothetical protein
VEKATAAASDALSATKAAASAPQGFSVWQINALERFVESALAAHARERPHDAELRSIVGGEALSLGSGIISSDASWKWRDGVAHILASAAGNRTHGLGRSEILL